MLQNNSLETRLLSSLVKVFADEELKAKSWTKGYMLSNEVYSFQVAYRWQGPMVKNINVRIDSELSPWITVRKVELLPSEMPCYWDHDDNILRSTPGLYPDLLRPIDEDGLTFLPNQWRSIWITIDPESEAKAGSYSIAVIFENQEGEELGRELFEIELIGKELPKQTLIHTQWFHCDCLATWYGVEVFSEDHWKIIERYVKTAADHGVNMILTPIFTPPLDTAVGGERPTVQLVDVEKNGSTYSFGFDKLKRWVDMCRSNGIEYFEFSHLFTQWGAKHAPKIVAKENGELKRIFGWYTDATAEEYKSFLDQFLPELVRFIEDNGLKGQLFPYF